MHIHIQTCMHAHTHACTHTSHACTYAHTPHTHQSLHMHSLAPVVAFTTAGDALLLPSPSAHAVILYWAPGTAGLIVTLLPLPVFTYCPIIGTRKRVTLNPVMTLSVMPSFLWTWYSTVEFVTLYTISCGALRGSAEVWTMIVFAYFDFVNQLFVTFIKHRSALSIIRYVLNYSNIYYRF